MKMDFDIKLYNVGWKGIETGGVSNGSPDFTTNPFVEFYVLWQNPVDLVAYNALDAANKVPYNDWVSYDGVVNQFKVTYTAGTRPAQDTNLKVEFEANARNENVIPLDVFCLPATDAGKYSDANCKADNSGSNGRLKTTTDVHSYTMKTSPDATKGYCKEVWTISSKT